jgi:hypothetical protein
MGRVDIEDLPQSDELDREAMRCIVGGGAAPSGPIGSASVGVEPVVVYPPGFEQRKRRPTRSGV